MESYSNILSIPILKRTTENNTHNNIVDESVKDIIPYKISIKKRFFALILYILSLGIFFVLGKIFLKLYLKLNCVTCDAKSADLFLIIDDKNSCHIVYALFENFNKKHELLKYLFSLNRITDSTIENQQTNFINKNEESLVIEYKKNKYLFNDGRFEPIYLMIENFTNKQIHEKFGNGLDKILEYNYLLNKFGLNIICLPSKSFVLIFFEKAIHPFYLYQILSIVVWILQAYYIFCFFVIGFSLLILLVDSYYKYQNYKKLLNLTTSSVAKIIRNVDISSFRKDNTWDILSNETQYIVPGDIIELEENDIIPADCILTDGFCTVNESDITGESSIVMKTNLPFDKEYFSFSNNEKSILFNGTKINKCESSKTDGKIRALVINTGFNTLRADLIQNIIFPRPSNFKFYKDVIAYFIGVAFIYFVAAYIYFWLINEKILFVATKVAVFDLLTIILPPSLPICLNFSLFYFHSNLSSNEISCNDEQRINAAGRVNVIVFDKTGTLTEKEYKLIGFQTTYVNKNGKVQFDRLESNTKTFNYFYRNFWKENSLEKELHPNRFSDYKFDLKLSSVYFYECLACCHGIDKFNGSIFGNGVDIKIFENLQWNILQEENDKLQNKIFDESFSSPIKTSSITSNYIMVPKKAYKIIEEAYFIKIQENKEFKNKKFNFKDFRIHILKRNNFSSNSQSMSVITYKEYDDDYRFFIKGSPEKIIAMCNPNSLPEDLDNILKFHTGNGCRVLACATKSLGERYLNDNNSDYTNLIFLGLIVFENKLKLETKGIINKLLNAKCQLLISTGDHPLTSISVGQQCSIIKDKYILIDFDDQLNFSLHQDKDKENLDFLKGENEDKSTSDRRLLDGTVNNTINNSVKNNDVTKCNLSLAEFFKLFENKLNFSICISGKAFVHIIHQRNRFIKSGKDKVSLKKYLKLEELIAKHSKIFYRMSPNDKLELILFLKENKSNVVAMCGDGSNDSSALMASDVGISLQSFEGTSLTAHFKCADSSIECVATIIKSGRACLESSMITFKIMILYSINQLSSTLVLYYSNLMPTNSQYLFWDLGIVFIQTLMISKTPANKIFSNEIQNNSILNFHFLISLIGQTAIQVSLLLIFYFKILLNVLTTNEYSPNDNKICVYNSFVFILSSFQYITSIFTQNFFVRNKKGVISNGAYTVYTSFLIFVLLSFCTLNYFNQVQNNFELVYLVSTSNIATSSSQICKIFTIIFSLANFILNTLFLKLLNKIFNY